MNAMVIVFIPARNGQPVTEQVSPLRAVDFLPQGTYSDNAKAGLHQSSEREQTTPPFWTWFIENPRPCGA
jgi:hypothetical protein